MVRRGPGRGERGQLSVARNSQWKRWVRWALVALAVADASLLVVRWQSGGSTPQAAKDRRDALRLRHAEMKADIERAAQIRDGLSQVDRQCDAFLKDQLLAAGSNYSTIVEDLSELSARAGLRTSAVKYKQRDVEKRGVTEVVVDATVEGDYASLVRFINSLERSEHFYLVNNLALASSTEGAIKLNLQLKTYFRT